MNCFKGCGFLLKEVTYYKGFAIIFVWLDAEPPTSYFSQTQFLVFRVVTNLSSLHMPQVATLEILSRSHHGSKTGPWDKGGFSTWPLPLHLLPLPWRQPSKLDCGKLLVQPSCWAALAAAKLLSTSFRKKQSRWKFPVGWSWPTDHCLDRTPPWIRAIYSLHRTDWPYCPLLQHNPIQSLNSVIKQCNVSTFHRLCLG